MSDKSEDELKKLRYESARAHYEPILSALNEKESALEKRVEELEEELVARKFEDKVQAKQDKIDQLALRKVALERKLKALENKLVTEGEAVI